jgi:flagellar M-ring protein FliF
MSFAKVDMPNATAAPAPFLGLDSSYWFKIIEVGILSLTALLIGFFVARPLIQRMFAPVSYAVAHAVPGTPAAAQLPAPTPASGDAQPGAGPQQLPAPRDSMIDISRIEGQVRESSVRKVGEVVQAHPEEALAILRTWLHQPV